jgi:hypothetical protein
VYGVPGRPRHIGRVNKKNGLLPFLLIMISSTLTLAIPIFTSMPETNTWNPLLSPFHDPQSYSQAGMNDLLYHPAKCWGLRPVQTKMESNVLEENVVSDFQALKATNQPLLLAWTAFKTTFGLLTRLRRCFESNTQRDDRRDARLQMTTSTRNRVVWASALQSI